MLHLLTPHPPFLLDRECRAVTTPASLADTSLAGRRAAYLQQTECVDHLLLKLVGSLLERSGTPPVILVVGDHGSALLSWWGGPAPDRPDLEYTTEMLHEMHGAFGAFYLPDGGERAFAEPVTLVNVLRNVFRHYLGADLPPRPNRYFTIAKVGGRRVLQELPPSRLEGEATTTAAPPGRAGVGTDLAGRSGAAVPAARRR
jgi:hypothetical protein